MKPSSVDRASQWWGWRPLGALAVVAVVGVILYIGWTVHQHNTQLSCINQGFNQVLNEALRHHPLRPPPDC